ncbi:MAG: MFS transporter, partial [Chloroflexi bacterium]|nr:MFS transporter [Chloroflexota bacterium]
MSQLLLRLAQRTGVFYGWYVVAALASIITFAGGAFFFGIGAIFDPILLEFGWSRAAVSFAFSLRAEVSGLGAPVIGMIADRVGSRKVLQGGVVMVALGFLAIASTQNLWWFYIAFILTTVGISACGGPVGMMTTATWFDRRRGAALGALTMGAGFGGITAPIMALLITNYGWRTALVITAGVIFCFAFPLTLVVRNRPEDVGMLPDGRLPEPSAAPTVAGARTAPVYSANDYTAKQAVKTRTFWVFSIAVAFLFLSNQAVVVHFIPFLTNKGFSIEAAALATTALTLTSLLGRISFGTASDRVDKRYAIAIASA